MIVRKDELSVIAFPLALKGGFFYIKLISTPFRVRGNGNWRNSTIKMPLSGQLT
jgi:hypothetical protein